MKKQFTSSQVAAFRLTRNHLLDSRPVSPAKIAADVCGIQAQVFSAAEMSLWARNHSLTRADIADALWKNRSLIKTSAMRGTLHVVAAADYGIVITALRNSRRNTLSNVMRRYSVTQREIDDVTAASLEALRSGPMSRGALTKQVLGAVRTSRKARLWFEKSAWGVIRPGVFEGLICYGPQIGNQVTFVRTDKWLPKQKMISDSVAREKLLRKYLAAYGPATEKDFAQWAGISMPEARAAWISLRDEIVEIRVDGVLANPCGLLRNDFHAFQHAELTEVTVRLLPNFDVYLLAHAEKGHVVAQDFYKRIYRNQGWISAVALLDGRAVGTWTMARGKRNSFKLSPFGKISSAVGRKIEGEASELAAFSAGESIRQ